MAGSCGRPARNRTLPSDSTATTDQDAIGNQSDIRVDSDEATMAGSVDMFSMRIMSTITSARAARAARAVPPASRRSARSCAPGSPSARSTSANRNGTFR